MEPQMDGNDNLPAVSRIESAASHALCPIPPNIRIERDGETTRIWLGHDARYAQGVADGMRLAAGLGLCAAGA